MRRRKTAIFFLVLGTCLTGLAIALNVGWILLNLREVAALVLGVIFFAAIITGLVLNTIFLVREIRRNEQHDTFLNAVTHELKTPIASIRLYLETLKTRDVSDEKREEFYDVMLADSQRLLNTVEQVLQASRTKEKRRELNLREIDLGNMLETAAALVKTQYNLDDAVVRVTEPTESVMILGDENELQTAFVNLLENAVKYSPTDPRISVRTKKAGLKKRVGILIKDNGVGIPPADLKRVFRRFYRVNGVTQAKGTGLGLAIVRSIIEKHGGRVRAHSRGPGHGSTFVVELPTADSGSESEKVGK
jgi:two-component system, OmpR family, sensor histidine kinase SenX3